MVDVAVDAQADPERMCAYLGSDAASIATDIAEVGGPTGGDWTTATWVVVDNNDSVAGWLLAETDADMSRAWWWGPMLNNEVSNTVEAAEQLFDAASQTLSNYRQHELALDHRSTRLARFAELHGFAAEEPSAVLNTGALASNEWPGDSRVVPLAVHHHASVIAMHDELFPGTHTTGDKLVDAGRGEVRLVIELPADPSVVTGYVATELQNDGSLYIDYLGVAANQRGCGLGRALVAESVRLGAAAGACHAHLTVRVANAAARQLYASLGFVEERILAPYRRGFTLA